MFELAATTQPLNTELKHFLMTTELLARNSLSGYAPDPHPEATAYSGCTFTLTDAAGAITRVLFRAAKLTPTKAGLFVTLWKRDDQGATRPYCAADGINEFYIAARTSHGYGYFSFPAEALSRAGILSSETQPGKRGFRLYTPWDGELNASATRTRAWQKRFFIQPRG